MYCVLVIFSRQRPRGRELTERQALTRPMMYTYIYIYIYVHTYIFFCFDSASLPFKVLNRVPGGCSGGEGTHPETLKCLTPNPYSRQRLELNLGPSHPDPTS